MRAQTYWLVCRGRGETVQALVDAYGPAADAIQTAGAELLSEFERKSVQERRHRFLEAGAPEALAGTLAGLGPMQATVEIAGLAAESAWPAEAAARLFHQAGAALGFERLRAAAAAIKPADLYERTAIRRLIADLVEEQTVVARAAATGAEPPADVAAAAALVRRWLDGREAAPRALKTLEEVEASPGGWSFAKLTIANAALRAVV